MQYQIVRGHDADWVERIVQKMCNEGWQPLGGIAIGPGIDSLGDDCQEYAQAVIWEDWKGEVKGCE